MFACCIHSSNKVITDILVLLLMHTNCCGICNTGLIHSINILHTVVSADGLEIFCGMTFLRVYPEKFSQFKMHANIYGFNLIQACNQDFWGRGIWSKVVLCTF